MTEDSEVPTLVPVLEDNAPVIAVKMAIADSKWFDDILEEFPIHNANNVLVVTKHEDDGVGSVAIVFGTQDENKAVDVGEDTPFIAAKIVFDVNTFLNIARAVALHHNLVTSSTEDKAFPEPPAIVLPN